MKEIIALLILAIVSMHGYKAISEIQSEQETVEHRKAMQVYYAEWGSYDN